ncbi:MAG: hypothetical protein QXR76_03255 [Candidatus Bathyarchaeia archaeon]
MSNEEFEAFKTVKSLLDSIDADKKRLDEELARIEGDVKNIEQLVYSDFKDGVPEEFANDKLLGLLDSLSNAVGYALQLVLEMERRIEPLEEIAEESEKNPSPQQQQPIIVQAGSSQKPEKKGFWASLLGGYFDYKTLRLQLEMQQKIEAKPTITQSQEVKDVLQFGRQIIPTLNEIKTWLKGCKCRLYFFQDHSLYYYYHVELQAYLSKVIGIIRSFAKSCMEYRKKELDRLKIELGKAVAQIATAEAYASGQRQVIEIPQPVSPGGFSFPAPQKRRPPTSD